MTAFQITTIIGITLVTFVWIAIIAKKKRKVWDNLKCGSHVFCLKPDGSQMLEYVMAVDKDNERVCLSNEGWVTMKDFLLGPNEYIDYND